MHCNFSNEAMRTAGSEELFSSMCDKLGEVHEEGIASYGHKKQYLLRGLRLTYHTLKRKVLQNQQFSLPHLRNYNAFLSSGMHCNFSNEAMRTAGSEELFSSMCDKLGEVHEEGIASYGSDNDMRLTGLHETQSIDKFSYGVSDRGASIRIPVYTVEHDWNGYLEDRRPASNADPYKILAHLVGTLTK